SFGPQDLDHESHATGKCVPGDTRMLRVDETQIIHVHFLICFYCASRNRKYVIALPLIGICKWPEKGGPLNLIMFNRLLRDGMSVNDLKCVDWFIINIGTSCFNFCCVPSLLTGIFKVLDSDNKARRAVSFRTRESRSFCSSGITISSAFSKGLNLYT
ncbi:hypothetical protein ROZALSC1DRAFT_26130, partial [Rozella allomycis CSF55]